VHGFDRTAAISSFIYCCVTLLLCNISVLHAKLPLQDNAKFIDQSFIDQSDDLISILLQSPTKLNLLVDFVSMQLNINILYPDQIKQKAVLLRTAKQIPSAFIARHSFTGTRGGRICASAR